MKNFYSNKHKFNSFFKKITTNLYKQNNSSSDSFLMNENLTKESKVLYHNGLSYDKQKFFNHFIQRKELALQMVPKYGKKTIFESQPHIHGSISLGEFNEILIIEKTDSLEFDILQQNLDFNKTKLEALISETKSKNIQINGLNIETNIESVGSINPNITTYKSKIFINDPSKFIFFEKNIIISNDYKITTKIMNETSAQLFNSYLNNSDCYVIDHDGMVKQSLLGFKDLVIKYCKNTFLINLFKNCEETYNDMINHSTFKELNNYNTANEKKDFLQIKKKILDDVFIKGDFNLLFNDFVNDDFNNIFKLNTDINEILKYLK